MIFPAQFKENVFALYGRGEIHHATTLRLHCLSSELFNNPFHRYPYTLLILKTNYPPQSESHCLNAFQSLICSMLSL